MVGAIVKRDIIAHPVVTVRCFGWSVFLRAVLAGPNTTFLSLLTSTETPQPHLENVSDFVGRCVELELKAGRLYLSLARRFEDDANVYGFFEALADQEGEHAQLLELAETAAGSENWDESKAAPWRSVVPQLESQMAQALRTLDDVSSVRDALRHVIAVESSEINDVFKGVIAASDSNFVRRINAFHDAERRHLRFVCRAVEKLDPELVPETEALANKIA